MLEIKPLIYFVAAFEEKSISNAYSHEDDHSFSPKLNTCSHPC
jgi:hypothetical protein